MKKGNKGMMIAIGAIALLVLGITCFFFMGGLQTRLSNYHGDSYDEDGNVQFSTDLFYRNDMKAEGADPFVLDNTKRDGYYYLYVTQGYCFCYRSTDLVTWEPVGNTLASQAYDSKQKTLTKESIWAPEVIYDEDTGLYYMYFSAKPQIEGDAINCLMYVATSESPAGPYEIVNFMDEEDCGTGNLHDYDTEQFPDDFASYCFLDPERYNDFLKFYAGGTAESEEGTYSGAIDPHPYVDENGDKYFFWKIEEKPGRICVMKMENWLKPDWDTATLVMCSTYYTVEDWEAAQAGETVETVPFEDTGTLCNEGPEIIKHNGKYYLTYSMNTYLNNSYQVGIAVADSVMGPYRKLTENEGGILLSGSATGSREVSGSGHHSFVTVGEQLYVIYHKHNNYSLGGGNRNIAVDEVKWVTTTDSNGETLDVLYTNGPTDTVQPLTDASAKYRNIAPQAAVKGDGELSYLTDGLLSVYKIENDFISTYVKETVIHQTTAFTFDFEKAQSVRAVMVYASKNAEQVFESVDVEITYKENGITKTGVIKDMQLSKDQYTIVEYNNAIDYIDLGANVFTEFDEKQVTSVKITVKVPNGQESVGISEIRILGKAEASEDVDKNVKQTYIPKFEYDKVSAQPDEGFTIDGCFDEKEYEGQRWLNLVKEHNSEWANLKATTYFGENGVYFACDVEENGQIYVNPDRRSNLNSCVELYLSNKGATTINCNNSFEIDMEADGSLTFNQRSAYGWTNVATTNDIMPILGAQTKGGEVNSEECYGYSVELFIPYDYLEYMGILEEGEKVEELYLNPVLVTSYSYSETNSGIARNWYNFAAELPNGGWSRPDKNFHFDSEGLVAHNLKLSSTEGGSISEKNGNDYAVHDSTIDLRIQAESGYTLESLIIDGEHYEDKLVFDSEGAVYTAQRVQKDLDVKAVFRQVSAENADVSGTVSYQGQNKEKEVLADLKVQLFDGYNFYPATLDSEGGYTASVPNGAYELILTSLEYEYTVARIPMDISADTTKDVTITDAVYGAMRSVTMKDFSLAAGSAIEELPSPIQSDTFVYGFKMGSDVQDAYRVNERYAPQASVYFGNTSNSLRVQVMKWGNAFYFKMAEVENNAITTKDFVNYVMSDSLKNALLKQGELQCYVVKNGNRVALYAENDMGVLEKITDNFDISTIASLEVIGIGFDVYQGVSSDYPAALTDNVLRGGTTDINALNN